MTNFDKIKSMKTPEQLTEFLKSKLSINNLINDINMCKNYCPKFIDNNKICPYTDKYESNCPSLTETFILWLKNNY